MPGWERTSVEGVSVQTSLHEQELISYHLELLQLQVLQTRIRSLRRGSSRFLDRFRLGFGLMRWLLSPGAMLE